MLLHDVTRGGQQQSVAAIRSTGTRGWRRHRDRPLVPTGRPEGTSDLIEAQDRHSGNEVNSTFATTVTSAPYTPDDGSGLLYAPDRR
jgi:hypothetical protein